MQHIISCDKTVYHLVQQHDNPSKPTRARRSSLNRSRRQGDDARSLRIQAQAFRCTLSVSLHFEGN